MTWAHAIAIVGAVGTTVLVVELVRRRQLRDKYAVLWLLFALGVLVLGVAPGVLDRLAGLLGIIEPVNALFFVGVLTLFGIAVHLSWEISRLENETRVLAEEIALLRLELGGRDDDTDHDRHSPRAY